MLSANSEFAQSKSIESQIETVFDRLWPICRSITGNGFRESLKILSEIAPYEKIEIPSGTPIFDWTIPPEWNIRDAYLVTPDGRRIAEFKKNNLHVMSYSIPINEEMDFEDLKSRIFTLPNLPDAIPYRTSYYKPDWGFCMRHRDFLELKPGRYRVVIDSTLAPGALTFGQVLLPSTEGNSEEVLISSYLCHPSMANNELSGPLVTSFLYKKLSQLPQRRFNYRFAIVSETIGSLAFLSRFGEHLKKHCVAGLVATCCGDDRNITYKKSRLGNRWTDLVVENVLKNYGKPFEILDFFPWGSDERQYCSPGFDLPVGSLMRTMYGRFAEYHTSLDDKSFISFSGMRESVDLYFQVCMSLEKDIRYQNLSPFGEPMLGKRGLYSTVGGATPANFYLDHIRYLLTYSDGQHSLLKIAEIAKCSILQLAKVAEDLEKAGLLSKIKALTKVSTDA